jgi:tRNA-2-methylthio-N6-dimethylallyladenosine synthase
LTQEFTPKYSKGMSATKKLYIQTYGCQMNEYDSRLIAGLLGEDGYARVDTAEQADLILVNTCAIRDKAEQKVFSLLGRYRDIKDARPEVMIGVGGCVAQEQGDAIRKRVPYVDLVFGTQNIRNIRELVAAAGAARGIVATEWALNREARFREDEMLTPYGTVDGITAFVTIAEGCDHFCSFCVVPYTRGREASRSPASILAEARALAEQGVVELTLLGQNVNSYGKKSAYPFDRLLEEVCAVPGLRRVRFMSSHPHDLSEAQLELYGRLDNLARHLHLPVQSGSDRVLERMNRRYTYEEYTKKMERLRAACPDVGLTTDILVGYPGETDEDFARTIDLMQEVRFTNLYAFKYSVRPGTRAATLPDQIPDEVMNERLQRVLDLQKETSLAYNGALVGRSMEVLVEKYNDGIWQGRTSCNRIVHFSGPAQLGALVDVPMIRAFPNSLRGELTEPLAEAMA